MEFKKNLVLCTAGETLKGRLLKKLVANYGYWLGGFFTEELRAGSAREGFLLRTPRGGSELLASVKMVSAVSFNKYGVAPGTLDGFAVRSLLEARKEKKIILMDELGPLTLGSDKLAAGALSALGSDSPCLATYRRGAGKFEEEFRRMGNTLVAGLRADTFAETEALAAGWIEFWMKKMESTDDLR